MNDLWQDCKPGTLVDLSKRARRDASQKHALRAGAGAVLGCLLMVGGYFAWTTVSEPDKSSQGVLSCRDALKEMDLYLAQDMDRGRKSQVEEHLSHCPRCRHKFERRAREIGAEYRLAVGLSSPSSYWPWLISKQASASDIWLSSSK